MFDFKLILDYFCQFSLALLLLASAWFIFKRAVAPSGSNLLERWSNMKDDDQLMALAVLLMAVGLPLAVGLVIFVLVTKPQGYDTLVGSLVTSLVQLGGLGMFYFFSQGHSGKKSAAALAEIAKEP